MHSLRFALGTALAANVLAPSIAFAGGRATWRDRFDQIVETFTGDPASGVDIDMKHVLDTWRGMHPKPLETLTPDEARRQPTPIEAAAILAKRENKPLEPYPMTMTTITFPGAASELKAQIYQSTPKSEKLQPVVVFFHGGGFVTDNAAGSDASARAIAGTSGFIVAAVDYRLAPENKFPAAQDDAAAAYKWVTENAASFGGDPDRVALAGEGAGGLLAADTAIAARDTKMPKASALILIAPAAGINFKTNSWMEDSAARPWNDKAVAWALNLYLRTPADKNDPRIDLVGKADVRNLPPTTIVTAEIDPLRSDGERLGGKLRRATVPVFMRDYPGVTHDFFGMGQVVEQAALAQHFVAARLKEAFRPPGNQALALEDLGIAPYPEAPDPASLPPGAQVPSVPVPSVPVPSATK